MGSFSYVELLANRATWAFPLTNIVFTERTEYQHVQIVESERYGRSLFLDGHHQCAAFEEFVYHELLTHPALMSLVVPAQKVGIVGGGEGATLREVLRHQSVQVAIQCDIDGRLIEICREQLGWDHGAYDDPRARLEIEDGRKWLERQEPGTFDVLIFDLPELGSGDISNDFYGARLLGQASRLLKPGGVFITHAGPIHMAVIDSFSATYHAVREVFPHVIPYLCPEFRWSFLVASMSSQMMERPALDERRVTRPLRYYTAEQHELLGRGLPQYLLEAIRR